MLGALLEVQMSRKCTPLCLDARFEVKMVENTRALLEFEMTKKRTRRRKSKSKSKKHHMLGPLLRVGCGKAHAACGTKHISK